MSGIFWSLNSLPSSIRNLTKVSTEEFKFKLDEFLSTLPDNPRAITRVELTSFTADFRNESLKLKVLPPYQDKWKKFSEDKKREELDKAMRDCFTDLPAVDYRFISPAKGKSWTKVSLSPTPTS